MQDAVKSRFLIFLAGLIFVPIGTIIIVLFAKGYRPNLDNRNLTVKITGIIALHSLPENAQITINGKSQPQVTDTSINLDPGLYRVEISKEGFQAWQKDLTVSPEIVTSITATLFPSTPTLKSVTTTGASQISLSPDNTKIAYFNLNSSAIRELYVLDLSESPFGLLNKDSRLLTALTLTRDPNWQIVWSPDSTELLVYNPVITINTSAYLYSLSSSQFRPLSDNVATLISTWKAKSIAQQKRQFESLPENLQSILATSSANILWSPKENKILYTATGSAVLQYPLQKPLPGSSTQTENRVLIPKKLYVYDLEEDRNFEITGTNWRWFPTSSHLYTVDGNKIIIKEYDNQNATVIYTGPLFDQVAIPYPSGKQMLILTNLTPTTKPKSTPIPNLYAINLR